MLEGDTGSVRLLATEDESRYSYLDIEGLGILEDSAIDVGCWRRIRFEHLARLVVVAPRASSGVVAVVVGVYDGVESMLGGLMRRCWNCRHLGLFFSHVLGPLTLGLGPPSFRPPPTVLLIAHLPHSELVSTIRALYDVVPALSGSILSWRTQSLSSTSLTLEGASGGPNPPQRASGPLSQLSQVEYTTLGAP